jgi:hypothetical protein
MESRAPSSCTGYVQRAIGRGDRLSVVRCWTNGRPAITGETNCPIDEFMTKPEVAQKLFEETLEIVVERPRFREVTRSPEPSAGAGAFYNLLPADKRLGIDIAV